MLSPETEARLCTLIKAIADSEKDVEIYRELLAEKPTFEPYAAFLRIDRYKKNNISAFDFMDFLV